MAKKGLKAVQAGKDWYIVVQVSWKWRSRWSQNWAKHQIAQLRGWLTGEKNVLCNVCGEV